MKEKSEAGNSVTIRKGIKRRVVLGDERNIEKQVNLKRNNNKKKSVAKMKSTGLSFLRELKLFSIVLVATLVVFFGTALVFYSVKEVSGYGMMPTLRNKDFVLIKRQNELKRFDLIFLDNGIEGEFRRIIGLPGERIEYTTDTLYVNDQPIDEKFLVDKINENQGKGKVFTQDFTLYDIGRVSTIPKGYYLILGDNRPYTTDSREYGLIKQEKVIGKAITRIWPLEAVGTLF